MSALAAWVLGGGLTTLIVALTGLLAALSAHGRISSIQQQKDGQGNAQAPAPQPPDHAA
jgi:hypothetical protein